MLEPGLSVGLGGGGEGEKQRLLQKACSFCERLSRDLLLLSNHSGGLSTKGRKGDELEPGPLKALAHLTCSMGTMQLPLKAEDGARGEESLSSSSRTCFSKLKKKNKGLTQRGADVFQPSTPAGNPYRCSMAAGMRI